MINRVIERLHRRRLAYQTVFLDGNKKPNPAGEEVLKDLKRYCGISKGGIVVSPISRMVDSHATAYRAGQRDTYLRIIKYLGLDESDFKEEDNERATADSD
jgi:hypothetical protein